MRYLVTTRKYIWRKKLDNFLNKLFPKYWMPLYSMVTFSRIRYSEVIKRREQQDKVMQCFSNWENFVILKKILKCLTLFVKQF